MSNDAAALQTSAVESLPTIEQVAAQVLSPAEKTAQETTEAPVESAQTEPQTTESAQPEPKPADEKKDPMASRFAALSRQEKELRQKQQEISKRNQDFEARIKDIEAREAKFTELKKSPLKTLKELGLSYTDLTQDAIGSYKEVEVDPATQKFNEFEQRLSKVDKLEAELTKKFAELDAKEATMALRQVTDSIRETAADEKYELIQTVGEDAITLVKDVMSEYWVQHQKVLDYPEACDIVEKYYDDYFDKLAKTRKIKSRFETKPVVTPQGSPKTPTAQGKSEVKGPISTLTHSQASAAQASVDVDKLPKHEALAYLARQLKFHD